MNVCDLAAGIERLARQLAEEAPGRTQLPAPAAVTPGMQRMAAAVIRRGAGVLWHLQRRMWSRYDKAVWLHRNMGYAQWLRHMAARLLALAAAVRQLLQPAAPAAA